jgi:hypothetical protein
MAQGIKQLQIASRNAVFLKAEAYFSLAWINLYYENRYNESLNYCKALHELYPGNFEFNAMYIKNMLLLKKYDEAELLLTGSETNGSEFYKAQAFIFKGIINEKKYLDNKTAQEYYTKGINEIAFFGDYGNEYAAYAYFGLSRISEANGEKQTGRIYRRMAEKLTDFKKADFDK